MAGIGLARLPTAFWTGFSGEIARKRSPGTSSRIYALHGARLTVVSKFLATTWSVKSIPTLSTPRNFV
jgi:hypothetical protein